MTVTTQQWAICPIDCCEYSQEYDPNAAHFCPDCGVELIWECPDCKCAVTAEDQSTCLQCGLSLKD